MTVFGSRKLFGSRARWLLLAALAFGCTTAAAAQEVTTTRIIPSADPDSWFDKADNPADLPRGSVPVGFVLDVDATGAVTGCTVTVASRIGKLDEISCALLRERARFEVPHAADGGPSAGAFAAWLNWQRGKPPHVTPPLNGKLDRTGAPLASPVENPLPWFARLNDGDATEEHRGVITAEVDAQGNITGCRAVPASDTFGCTLMRKHGRFRPAYDALGRPVAGVWSIGVGTR